MAIFGRLSDFSRKLVFGECAQPRRAGEFEKSDFPEICEGRQKYAFIRVSLRRVMKKIFLYFVRLSFVVMNLPLLCRECYDFNELAPFERHKPWQEPKNFDEFASFYYEFLSGDIQDTLTADDLVRINEYLISLAEVGSLLSNPSEKLHRDIEELRQINQGIYAYYKVDSKYAFHPAVLLGTEKMELMKCGGVWNWIKRKTKKTGEFLEEHGAKILALAIAGAAIYDYVAGGNSDADDVRDSLGSAAAFFSAGEAKNYFTRNPNHEKNSNDCDNESSTQETVVENIKKYKQTKAKETFEDKIHFTTQRVPEMEMARVDNAAMQHQIIDNLFAQNSPSKDFEFNSIPGLNPDFLKVHDIHHDIDRKYNTDFHTTPTVPEAKLDYNSLSFAQKANISYDFCAYQQSIDHYTHALEANPNNPDLYLNRSLSYLETGDYDKAYSDYTQYSTSVQETISNASKATADFAIGFAEGFPRGLHNCGSELYDCAYNTIRHPIRTTQEVYEGMSTLAKLAHDYEFALICESFSPEAYKLATQWHTLPNREKGELAGYCTGKYGPELAAIYAAANPAKVSKALKPLSKAAGKLRRGKNLALVEAGAASSNSPSQFAKFAANIKGKKFQKGRHFSQSAKRLRETKTAGQLEILWPIQP